LGRAARVLKEGERETSSHRDGGAPSPSRVQEQGTGGPARPAGQWDSRPLKALMAVSAMSSLPPPQSPRTNGRRRLHLCHPRGGGRAGEACFSPQGSSTRHAGAAAAATPPRRPPPLLCHHPRLGGRVKETLDASRSEIFSPASRDGGRSAMNRRMHITRSTEFSLSWTNEAPRKGGACLPYQNWICPSIICKVKYQKEVFLQMQLTCQLMVMMGFVVERFSFIYHHAPRLLQKRGKKCQNP